MRYLRLILIVAFYVFCGSVTVSFARGDRKETSFGYDSFGLNLRPSYVMPTHGFYNGWNPSGKPIRTGGTVDVYFGFSNKERAVYHGVGAAVHTFFADELLGTPATLYIFQGAPLVALSEKITLGYEWNLGVSSGWKNNGVVTASPLNVYINVAALFDWKVTPYWDITFGPEYTHFSNGDTMFPNGGANTVNFRVGAKRHIAPSNFNSTENIFEHQKSQNGFWRSVTYDLVLLGGFRADRSVIGYNFHVFNNHFPFIGLHMNPLYRFNGYISAGPSIDLMYDRSANLIVTGQEDDTFTFDYPPFLRQTSVGLSARAELRMPVFAVNIGIGYSFQLENHTRYKSGELNSLYGIFALKAFVTDRLFLNVSYRLSSVLYSHNLMFGLGWRFGSI